MINSPESSSAGCLIRLPLPFLLLLAPSLGVGALVSLPLMLPAAAASFHLPGRSRQRRDETWRGEWSSQASGAGDWWRGDGGDEGEGSHEKMDREQ